MPDIRRFNPEGLWCGRSSIYSHGVSVSGAGRTVYLAGQVARDENGDTVGRGDVRVQADQVLRNLQTVLAAAGGTFKDVVKVTVYTTDLRLTPAMDEVRKRYFGDAAPASTLVEVRKLAHPDYLLEIEAVAVLP